MPRPCPGRVCVALGWTAVVWTQGTGLRRRRFPGTRPGRTATAFRSAPTHARPVTAKIRRMAGRPPQPNGSGGPGGDGARGFHANPTDPGRPAIQAARRRRRVVHHRIGAHRQAGGAPRRIHARQPAHPALPHHARSRPHRRAAADWDVQRREWFDSVEIIRPDEQDTNPVQQWNKGCVGCHVSQQDNHYKRRRDLRHGVGGFRDLVRALPGPGGAHVARAAAHDAPVSERSAASSVRRGSTPPESSMVCAQCHSLRDAVRRPSGPARILRLLRAEARIHAAQGAGSRVLGRRPAAAFLERRDRALAEPLLPARRPTCATCHDPHRPDVDRHPSSPPRATRCARGVMRHRRALSAHTRHAPASAGSACVECHMPRAVLSIKARFATTR